MIKIDPSVEPNYLGSDSVTKALDRIRKKVNAKLSPVIEKADEIWRNKEVTDKLYESHHGKCCYCERRRDRKRDMDVEHYRPKGEVKEDARHMGYWWLAYTWGNLLWSCHTCNQKYKDTKFSLLPKSKRAYDEGDDLTLERPHLINPKSEDPSHFLSYHIDRGGGRCFIKAIPRGGIENDEETRASATIIIIELNRKEYGYDLVQERGDDFLKAASFENTVFYIMTAEDAKKKSPLHRQEYIDSINDLREELKIYIQSKRVFSGVYRDYLRRHNIEYESLLQK